MTPEHFAQWQESFEAFHARFARFFRRSEPRTQARNYLRGLLSPVPRKNSWQMAEAVGEPDPASMQYLLYGAKWDADAVGVELQQFVVEEFGDPEGMAVLDESAFVKKGDKSAGVKRQWCSTLGKKENCQVGVFLTYVSRHGHTFLDRRLYLPREWCDDGERRRAAQVPDAVEFKTKPELAQQMLQHAWERGVPMRWVTGDEVYGNSPELRDAIHTHGQQQQQQRVHYVLAIGANTRIWQQRPAVEPPSPATGGRPRKHPRVAAGASRAEEVATLVARWGPEQWERLAVAAGEKGPRTYDWAAQRVVEAREGLPGQDLWLLARRSLSAPQEVAYYFSDAPADTPLLVLARVAGARWSIEQCLEEGKGEAGLAQYEVRYWQSWQRHITLSMMAHAWLASLRRREREREREEQVAAEAGEKRTGDQWPRPTGGGQRARGPASAGGGVAAAAAVGGGEVSLVALPPPDAPASAAEPPPPARRRLQSQ